MKKANAAEALTKLGHSGSNQPNSTANFSQKYHIKAQGLTKSQRHRTGAAAVHNQQTRSHLIPFEPFLNQYQHQKQQKHILPLSQESATRTDKMYNNQSPLLTTTTATTATSTTTATTTTTTTATVTMTTTAATATMTMTTAITIMSTKKTPKAIPTLQGRQPQ